VPYYLGIDGGGTKTTCAVGDEANTLATATSGPSNVVRVGEAKSRESLLQGIRQVCAAAGIAPEEIEATCVGGSGAARPEVAAVIREIIAEIVRNPIVVVGDMETTTEAAFGSGPGVIVIAGTGSMAYGRNGEGKTARAGGWGFAIGDEGSAHWIGRMAVNAALRNVDERDAAAPPASLEQALCKAWGVVSPLELARAANAVPSPDFATLLPAVLGSDDLVGHGVLNAAGRELARIAGLVIRRLFSNEEDNVPVAMTGGVFRHAGVVREVFYNELRRLDSRAEIRAEIVDPVDGALRIARRTRD
jgi:glucosamine kinase